MDEMPEGVSLPPFEARAHIRLHYGETNAQLPISALLFELDMTAAPGAIVASAKASR